MTHQQVSFDLDLYRESAIEQAIRDYRDIAVFSIDEKGTREWRLSLSWSKYDEEQTEMEFANYVLALSMRK